MKKMNQADISDVLGHSEKTIQRWLDRGGQHSERLHEAKLKGLALTHIQLDELFTRVRQYGKRTWVWTAIDGQTRLLVAWAIGGRKHLSAHELMHKVVKRLADEGIPIFTSDGLNHYYYTLTAHLGQWTIGSGKRKPVWRVAEDLLYGQFRKVKSGYRLKRVYTKIVCGTRDQMETGLKALGFSGKIQTAYVERLNLTLRHIIAPLARRTLALADNRKTLRLRIALGAAYYNFCRPHQSLATSRHRKQTPAMAAGITDSPWTVRQFVLHPVY
jgi:IS1 family transposase